MPFDGPEKQMVQNKKTGGENAKVFISHQYPRPMCQALQFRAKTGYKNPFDYLKRYFAKDKPEKEQKTI